MPNISVTYTFSNSTTADATQVNQNFTDIINGTSDGTKNFSINAITCASTATLLGNITLGNSSSNTITVNGSIASSVPMSANNSWDIGGVGLGVASVYLGSAASKTTKLIGGATANWTMTLPTTAGTAGYIMQTDGTGVTSWSPVQRGPDARQNYSLSASVGSSALTITLNAADGTTPSASNPVNVNFRNVTASTGTPILRSVTGALSMTVPSGATLGQTSGINQYVWVYLIDDAGVVDLGVSGVSVFNDGSVQPLTTISGVATSGSLLYSGIAHTGSKPVRLIGRLLVNEVSAGTWASAPTEIAVNPIIVHTITDWKNDLTFTPNNFGTVTNNNFYYRRVGDTMEIQGRFTCGTVAASTASVTLPSGLVMDTSKAPAANTILGIASTVYSASTNIFSSGNATIVFYDGSTTSQVFFAATGASGALVKSLASNIAISSVDFVFTLKIPIAGWSAYGP